MRITLSLLLQIAGLMHLGLMAAGLLMPKVVNMRAHLAGLPSFVRQLFWVYYTFIGLSLVGFGLITVVFAETLASGSGFARAVATFLAVFWMIRLVAAVFVFDVSPYLASRRLRIGYHATSIVFAYLPIVYAWAALQKPVV